MPIEQGKTSGRPLVIAHRGLSARFPENTMPSWQAAIDAKADLVELDFRTTRDGVLVCVHDGTLDRYLVAGGPDAKLAGRAIETMSMDEINAVDIGAWKGLAGTRIATLDEAVGLFTKSDCVLLAEQKTGTVGQTLEMLGRCGMDRRVIVQSFNWPYLRELHAAAPEVQIAALGGGEVTPQRIEEIGQTGARWAHWSEQAISPASLAMLHGAGLGVWVFTVNSEIGYRGAVAMGIDGVTTDRCDFAREVFLAGAML